MIRDDAALSRLLPRVAAAEAVAVDTEFHTERHYHPRLMLVQLRVDEDDPVLIDPMAPLDWGPLCAALSEAPLIVHGGQADVALLDRLGGLRPARLFDTQIAAGCVGGGYPVRLQELVRRHLGVHMDKAETLSDWSRRPLSDAQLRYAREDVVHLAALARALKARLAERGNVAIAEGCTAEIYARVLAPPDPLLAWRVIPGAHLLDDTERAVLQALAAWREEHARELDVPRSNIAPDATLLDIARRQPNTPEALRGNRRLPTHLWKRDAAALLTCVARGRCATPPNPLVTRTGPWVDLVRAAARVAECERGVAMELTLDATVLEKLAGGHPVEGWRADALGERFSAFLEGRVSVALPGVFISADYNS